MALTPECAWACQQQDLAYRRFDDYCSGAALNELAEATLHRQYAWAQWLDTALAQAVPEFAAAGFFPARGQLYLLKRTIDNFILPARLLLDFVGQARPDRVIAFERPSFCPSFDGALRERPLFALVAPAVLGEATRVELWPDVAETRGQQTSGTSIAHLAERVRRAGIARVLRRVAGSLAYAWRNLAPSRVQIAWVGHDYDLGFAVPLLQRRRLAVRRPPRRANWNREFLADAERVRAALEAHWEHLAVAPELWRPLDAVSRSLRHLPEPFLKVWISRVVPRMWAEFLGARSWLVRGGFKALMGTESSEPLVAAQFMAARGAGVTRIAATHNPPAGAAERPVQDAIGPTQCDVYLVNGEGDVDYFTALGGRLGVFERARTVPVGSARLDAMRRSRAAVNARKLNGRAAVGTPLPTILYVPTNFAGCYQYFNEGYLSDVAYFELQQRILKCCGEFRGIRVLYKPFPGGHAANPIGEFIARHVPNGQVTWTHLDELIWVVDAIMIDFPSTTWAEALLTDKPLLLHAGGDWGRLLPRAKAALQKRAWVSETPDEFEAQVRKFLSAGDFAPLANPDDEFLRLYVTHLNDGRSAERAAEVIARVVLEGELPV